MSVLLLLSRAFYGNKGELHGTVLTFERREIYSPAKLWNFISFCINTGIHFFDNSFSSEQVEEMDVNIFLFLYFEDLVSQCNSIKDKDLIQLIPNEDMEQQMHISQTQPQNAEDQKVPRRTSVEERLCKPQGKYIWNKFINFCAITLYSHECNGEEAGHCAKKKYFISD